MEANFAFREHYLMKLKTCHIALLAAVLLAFLLPLGAFAQDSRGGLDVENAIKDPAKQDQDTPIGGENLENRTNIKSTSSPSGTETTIIRDADIKKPLPKAVDKSQKEAEKVQKQEEDPLSFNFLYYIIEKFKLSDIVE
jgi:hypothetical protein